MAEFTVNAQRFDPYKNFKLRVKWDGRYVAGISKVGPLKRITEVIKHREGGDPSTSRKSPGVTEFEAIALERGVTHDQEFEKWANKVWTLGAPLGSEVSLKDFNWRWHTKCFDVGFLNTRLFRNWTRTLARSRSRRLTSKTKVGNAQTRCPRQR